VLAKPDGRPWRPHRNPSVATRVRSINLSILLRPWVGKRSPSTPARTLFAKPGKVAIMTLINALAILLYVMFLRKH
jgi:hypothetical protein